MSAGRIAVGSWWRLAIGLLTIFSTTHCPAGVGTWNQPAGGSWVDATNWTAIPQVAGDVARFTTHPTQDATITVNEAVVLGALEYSSGVNTTIGGVGPLRFDNQSNPATISVLERRAGFLNFTVPIELSSDLEVVSRSRTRLDLNGGIRSIEGHATDLQLSAQNRGDFQVLGGLDLNGDLSIRGQSKTFFAGATRFESLYLEAEAEAIFESPFAADLIDLGEGAKLTVEQPSTVKNLRLRNGVLDTSDRLTVTGTTTAFEGVINVPQASSLFAGAFEKRGSGNLSLTDLDNDLEGTIVVRDGSLILEYPSQKTLATTVGPGSLSLDGDHARLVVSREMSGSPLRLPINLNSTRGPSFLEGALSGSGKLAGPLELGAEASHISGGFVVEGPISGGSLILSGGVRFPTAVHTYRGETVVRSGELLLLGEGRLTETSRIRLESGGSLLLEPTTVAQRVADNVPIVIDHGRLGVSAPGTLAQGVGRVEVTGSGTISIDDMGELTIDLLTVEPLAMLSILMDPARSRLQAGNLAAGDLPSNIRHGQTFAKYRNELGILPLAEFELESNQARWNATTHAIVEGRATLSENKAAKTLSLRSRAQDPRLTLSNQVTLNVVSGGIQYDGRGQINGSNARLTAGDTAAAHLYVAGQGELELNVPVSDNAGPDNDFTDAADNGAVGVVVSGHLVMSAANSYSGSTVIHDGSLRMTRPASISAESDFVLRGGSLNLDFNGTARFRSLTLETSSGSVGGDFASVEAGLITLKGGSINNHITGSTPIIKAGPDRAMIQIDPQYTGRIEVRAGILDMRQVQPPGVIFGDDVATIELAPAAHLNFTSGGEVRNLVVSGSGSINYFNTGQGTVIRPGSNDDIGTLQIDDLFILDGGTYEWQLSNALGPAGEGWDHLVLPERLVGAEATNPLVVKIAPLPPEGADRVANFDRLQTYSWEIARSGHVDRHVIDNGRITIDDSLFSSLHNALPASFTLAYDEHTVFLRYGEAADLNGDGAIDGSDLDTACAQGRDIPTFLQDRLGTTVGDSNLDGMVDFTDFLVLSAAFGKEGGWESGNFNCDPSIDFADFLMLSTHFATSANEIANVPEPINAATLLTCLFLLLLQWRPTRSAGRGGLGRST